MESRSLAIESVMANRGYYIFEETFFHNAIKSAVTVVIFYRIVVGRAGREERQVWEISELIYEKNGQYR